MSPGANTGVSSIEGFRPGIDVYLLYVYLNSEKSRFFILSRRTPVKVRARLPEVKLAGCANAAVLNH